MPNDIKGEVHPNYLTSDRPVAQPLETYNYIRDITPESLVAAAQEMASEMRRLNKSSISLRVTSVRFGITAVNDQDSGRLAYRTFGVARVSGTIVAPG